MKLSRLVRALERQEIEHWKRERPVSLAWTRCNQGGQQEVLLKVMLLQSLTSHARSKVREPGTLTAYTMVNFTHFTFLTQLNTIFDRQCMS